MGYAGLRPYNLYRPAQLLTRKVDVKLAPGLRIGYIMGTGDEVPDAIEALGVMPHLLTTGGDRFGRLFPVECCGCGNPGLFFRARTGRGPATAQCSSFAMAERSSCFTRARASLPRFRSRWAAPSGLWTNRRRSSCWTPPNPLLTRPTRITSADFDGWVEERGHSFLESWDPAYTALTETADPGQDPQRGGLVVAHPGKGTYIYVAYALHRQLPELVPGAYRILANLLSAGR